MGKYGNFVEYKHEIVLEYFLRKYSSGNIHDAGCGNNSIDLENMLQIVTKLIGVDKREEVCAVFSKQKSRLNFVQADLTKLPFKAEFFDLILMRGVYGNAPQLLSLGFGEGSLTTDECRFYLSNSDIAQKVWENQENILKETARVLKPHGVLIASNSLRRDSVKQTKERFERYYNVKIHNGIERYLVICTKPGNNSLDEELEWLNK